VAQGLVERTAAYEAWLRKQVAVVDADLALKHKRMAEGAFPFLRATFYRWVDLWREVCPHLADTPPVLAVGDLHIENFGTWRDAEGRLVWGVNDFDEACPMPFAIDLVRLAASTLLAIAADALSVDGRGACDAILEGYAGSIAASGKPFVLEESHPTLRMMALSERRDPVRFWSKMSALPETSAPAPLRKLLAVHLPDGATNCRIAHRVAGLGSLGRERYVALATWRGGMVAREAKALLPSAYAWACGEPTPAIRYLELAGRAVRCPDPFLDLREGWLLRRLAPHCTRIELSALPRKADELHLLRAMGAETGNIHQASRDAVPAIGHELAHRKPGWLYAAAQAMAEATIQDWKRWKAAA
jgi:Ser/Thr protein kinase RdoA (MazF antagonist)